MISLAVVMGGYAVAKWVHASVLVAMAVAGLLIGNHAVSQAMIDKAKDRLLKFWSVTDDIFNIVLLLLIGLEVVTILADPRLIAVCLAAIPLASAAPAVSVLAPLLLLRPFLTLGPRAPNTLIWGGLRAGISVALAPALPLGSERSAVLAATYAVVLFAVIVGGGTIGRVLESSTRRVPLV